MRLQLVFAIALLLSMASFVGLANAQADNSIRKQIRIDELRKLDVVVAEFNELAANHVIGADQPPLTTDEVVAAIRRWPHDRKIADEKKKQFIEIAETRMLNASVAPGTRLSFSTGLQRNGNYFTVWWIDLTFERYTFRIRDRTISSRPMTDAEKKAAAAASERMKEMMKNRALNNKKQ